MKLKNYIASFTLLFGFALINAVNGQINTDKDLWIDPRCTMLPAEATWPMVVLSDGNLLKVSGNNTYISEDNGKTWSAPRPIFTRSETTKIGEAQILKTYDGTLILVFMDLSDLKWEWDKAKNEPGRDNHLSVWALRSQDKGKTWVELQEIFDGYCGSLRTMIQTSTGNIVIPVQRLMYNHGRHATVTYVSRDDGHTWNKGSNIIDIGGWGDHDGGYEATLTELKDGRLWMLIRTNLDQFWSAYSDDGGLYWRRIEPSGIDASSAPGYIKRLASGRLVLVWSRLNLANGKKFPRKSGKYSEVPASWQRKELSIAFSEDDGKTWSKPVVFAKILEGKWLSYPNIMERKPGELWIWALQGGLRVSLREEDFTDTNKKR